VKRCCRQDWNSDSELLIRKKVSSPSNSDATGPQITRCLDYETATNNSFRNIKGRNSLGELVGN